MAGEQMDGTYQEGDEFVNDAGDRIVVETYHPVDNEAQLKLPASVVFDVYKQGAEEGSDPDTEESPVNDFRTLLEKGGFAQLMNRPRLEDSSLVRDRASA